MGFLHCRSLRSTYDVADFMNFQFLGHLRSRGTLFRILSLQGFKILSFEFCGYLDKLGSLQNVFQRIRTARRDRRIGKNIQMRLFDRQLIFLITFNQRFLFIFR